MRDYWYTRASRHKKLEWMLNHQHLWEGWENFSDNRKRDVVEKMKKDGLLSEKTYWKDVSIVSLIIDARILRRKANDSIRSEKRMRS